MAFIVGKMNNIKGGRGTLVIFKNRTRQIKKRYPQTSNNNSYGYY